MDRLFDLLKESVKLRLSATCPWRIPERRIDSSTIVGPDAGARRSPLKTFSIGFEEASYNELPTPAGRPRVLNETRSSPSAKALDLTGETSSATSTSARRFFHLPDIPGLSMSRPAGPKSSSPATEGMRSSADMSHYQAQKIASCGPVGWRESGLSSHTASAAARKKALEQISAFLPGFGARIREQALSLDDVLTQKDRSRLYSADCGTSWKD